MAGQMAGLRVPLSTLHPRCCHRRRMTRGQDGFANSFPVRLFHPQLSTGLSRRFRLSPFLLPWDQCPFCSFCPFQEFSGPLYLLVRRLSLRIHRNVKHAKEKVVPGTHPQSNSKGVHHRLLRNAYGERKHPKHPSTPPRRGTQEECFAFSR